MAVFFLCPTFTFNFNNFSYLTMIDIFKELGKYFNTNQESGEVLRTSIIKTKTQYVDVYNRMKHLRKPLTMREVWEDYQLTFKKEVPFSSINGRVSDLFNDGLITTAKDENGNDKMVMGIYGKKVHQYIIND